MIAQGLVYPRPPELGVVARLEALVVKTSEEGGLALQSINGKIHDVEALLGQSQEQCNRGEAALNALDGSSFALPPSDQKISSLGALKAALDNANTLKGELGAYVPEGKKRQGVLTQAAADAGRTAGSWSDQSHASQGSAAWIMDTNGYFNEMMQRANSTISIPDVADTAATATDGAPSLGEVGLATNRAHNAISRAGGAVNAQAADADVAIQEAVAAMQEMRKVQRSYLGAIQRKVEPPAAPPAAARDQAGSAATPSPIHIY